MDLLHVSWCLLRLLAISYCLSQYHRLAACLSLSPMVAVGLSLSLPVPSSCCRTFTVFSSSMELLYVPHCLQVLLSVSHYFSDPMELLHVSHCLSFLLASSNSLHGFFFISLTVSHVFCLSLTVLLVSWSCYLSLIVAGCLSLSLSFCPNAMELLHVSHCLFQFHGVATCLLHSLMFCGCPSMSVSSYVVVVCLSLSFIVADCLSLSLPVPWSYCMSFTACLPW